MRPQKVQDQEMLEGLMSVLRAKGYDGASLKDLAEASGLKKASLYHRFPGGKKEMTEAVLSFVGEWVDRHILEVLQNKEVTPSDRLDSALKNINTLYQSGEAICIFRSLSTDIGLELFGTQIQQGIQKWIDAFARLGVDFGKDKTTAKSLALQSYIEIQGSLVIAKGMNSNKIFKATLKKIKERYQ